MAFGLGDRLALARASLALITLDQLDDVWTSYLGAATATEVEAERSAVVDLGRSIAAAMPAARYGAETVLNVLQATSDDAVEKAVEAIGAQAPSVVEAFRLAFADVLEEYSVRGLIIEACLYLRDQLPSDFSDLSAKVSRIEAGGFVEGDLPQATKCALAVVIAGVGIADLVVTGGAVTHIALSTVGKLGALALACASTASSIWGRLRGKKRS
jgi:hypothetical protein